VAENFDLNTQIPHSNKGISAVSLPHTLFQNKCMPAEIHFGSTRTKYVCIHPFGECQTLGSYFYFASCNN
jgi:hypothetical protein